MKKKKLSKTKISIISISLCFVLICTLFASCGSSSGNNNMMGDKSNQSTDLKMAGEDGYLTENYDTGTYISGSNSPNVSDSSSNISTETGQLNENTNNDLEHRKLIKNVKAVSYTHLDVYKRQNPAIDIGASAFNCN